MRKLTIRFEEQASEDELYELIKAWLEDPDSPNRINRNMVAAKYRSAKGPLYRAQNLTDSQVRALRKGTEVKTRKVPLQSWTTDPEVAASYSDDMDNPVVLERDVEPEQIVVNIELYAQLNHLPKDDPFGVGYTTDGEVLMCPGDYYRTITPEEIEGQLD
jgi:hypothetical protein